LTYVALQQKYLFLIKTFKMAKKYTLYTRSIHYASDIKRLSQCYPMCWPLICAISRTYVRYCVRHIPRSIY